MAFMRKQLKEWLDLSLNRYKAACINLVVLWPGAARSVRLTSLVAALITSWNSISLPTLVITCTPKTLSMDFTSQCACAVWPQGAAELAAAAVARVHGHAAARGAHAGRALRQPQGDHLRAAQQGTPTLLPRHALKQQPAVGFKKHLFFAYSPGHRSWWSHTHCAQLLFLVAVLPT